jgi:hypothetical protein
MADCCRHTKYLDKASTPVTTPLGIETYSEIAVSFMPQGKYYVGDLRFVLDNDGTWDEVCNLRKVNHRAGECGQGHFTTSNGREIVIFDTAYGPDVHNGLQHVDLDGKCYTINSGSIGLTLAEGLDNTQHGNIIEFEEKFMCMAKNSWRPGQDMKICFFGNEVCIATTSEVCDGCGTPRRLRLERKV